MTTTEFVYTTYIRTTPEKVWTAITNPEFCRQYWAHFNVSDWKKGSTWQHISAEHGNALIVGEVLEVLPPNRLVLSWVSPGDTAPKSEHSRVTFEITTIEDMVCLNVIHSNLKVGSDMAGKIANGWPRVLSSMKSLLETGTPLNTMAGKTDCSKPSTADKVA